MRRADYMASYAIELAKLPIGGYIRLPQWATKEEIALVIDLADELRASKSRALYESQADGIY